MKPVFAIFPMAFVLGLTFSCSAFSQDNPSPTRAEKGEAVEKKKNGKKALSQVERDRLSSMATSAKVSLITGLGYAVPTPHSLVSKNLIDADIIGADGSKIAKVSNLIINGKGEITKLVISDGGFFGIQAEKLAVNYDQLKTNFSDGENPRLQVALTEEGMKAVAECNEEDMAGDDFMVTDVAGKKVALLGSNEKGELVDFVFDKQGTAKYLILKFGGDITGSESKKIAVDFKKVTLSRHNDIHAATITVDEIETADWFEYNVSDISVLAEY